MPTVVNRGADGRNLGHSLAGRQFHWLTVIEPTDRRDNGYVVWRARCRCGHVKRACVLPVHPRDEVVRLPAELRPTHRNLSGLFAWSGIDRIDPKIGYVPDNCVPCCPRCNFAKGPMTGVEFRAWIKRVHDHLGL